MIKKHPYSIKLNWTGNTGEGTTNYRNYLRDHEIAIEGKQKILCSSDPSFRGDPSRYNPEELLVASLSGCHMLWYLHLCAVNGVNVLKYEDHAEGVMNEKEDGSGIFEKVTLKPWILIDKPEMTQKAHELHHEANKKCFIANSCNFPVVHEPEIFVRN